MLSAARDAWWQRVLAEGEQQMRRLCAERGLNWDTMTEEERESLVDDLIHEYRACAPHTEHRHLLPLGSYQGIAIVSAADFMGLVAGL
jgi:hypothetical protein